MSISKKVSEYMQEGSWIRRVFEEGLVLKQKLGERNVFDLSLGNPVMEPPPEFPRELQRWVNNPLPGMHRYMPNAGYPETRAAVAEALSAETGLQFRWETIVMTVGAAGAANVVMKVILNPGDEVIVLAPYFWEYTYYIENHGGVRKAVLNDATFQPDLEAIEAAMTPHTRALLINSPNNPTGAVYSAETLRRLGDLLQRKETEYGTQIFLVSDEPYRRLVYDGLESLRVFPYHRSSIVVTSHSKDLAIPGERIGYIAIHPECEGVDQIANACAFCNRTLGFVNAPALMQHVVARLQNVSVDVSQYERKRDFLYESLTSMGYSLVKPQGAFYMYPRSPVADDLEFVAELRKHLVLAVPGRGFGLSGHFRISYCVEDWTIEGCLEGFRETARRYGLC